MKTFMRFLSKFESTLYICHLRYILCSYEINLKMPPVSCALLVVLFKVFTFAMNLAFQYFNVPHIL